MGRLLRNAIANARDKLGSKSVPDLKPRDRLFSHAMLRRKMSEVISLRERVAQAELAVSDRVAVSEASRQSISRPRNDERAEGRLLRLCAPKT
jgi:hypothetical protein